MELNDNLERLLLLTYFGIEDGIGVDCASRFVQHAAYILGFSADQIRDGLAQLHRLGFVHNHELPADDGGDWIEVTDAGGDQALQTLDRIGRRAS